jgi:hypothetical protein
MRPFVYTKGLKGFDTLFVYAHDPDTSIIGGASHYVPHGGAHISDSDNAFIKQHFDDHELIVFISPYGVQLTDNQYDLALRAIEKRIPFVILPEDICRPDEQNS